MDNEIIKKDELAETSLNDSIQILPDNTLFVTESTPGLDYKNILAQIVQYVDIGAIIGKIEKGVEYVVKVPAQYEKEFNSGEYFIMQNQTTKKLWPTLMKINDEGRQEVVTPLEIVEKNVVQGNPMHDLAVNYHNLLMQQEMQSLTALVEDTYKHVQRIEHGQMDDRIAKLMAGKKGLMLALSMPEGESRRQMINNSRQSLLEAQSQIEETLKRRISEFEPIPESWGRTLIKELSHSGYLSDRDRDVEEMQIYYDFYLQATKMIAGSYLIEGDIQTAENAFLQSQEFLSKIDFSNVKTIGYIHKDIGEMFFDYPVTYLETEKALTLDAAKEYDEISIQVTGDQLLEVLNKNESEEISKTEIEE